MNRGTRATVVVVSLSVAAWSGLIINTMTLEQPAAQSLNTPIVLSSSNATDSPVENQPTTRRNFSTPTDVAPPPRAAVPTPRANPKSTKPARAAANHKRSNGPASASHKPATIPATKKAKASPQKVANTPKRPNPESKARSLPAFKKVTPRVQLLPPTADPQKLQPASKGGRPKRVRHSSKPKWSKWSNFDRGHAHPHLR